LPNCGTAAWTVLPDAAIEMKKILSSSEVVSCLTLDHISWELVAQGEAFYNESSSELIAHLKSELRPISPKVHHPCPNLDWLPPQVTQREFVPIDEAFSVARDIFHSWVSRIQKHLNQFLESQSATPSLSIKG